MLPGRETDVEVVDELIPRSQLGALRARLLHSSGGRHANPAMSRDWRRLVPGLMLALLSAGCGGGSAASVTPLATATAATTPVETSSAQANESSGSSLTYVMFGDSWPYGAHCNGCRPFPGLLKDAYAAATGQAIDFRNDTTNGGTARELAAKMKSDKSIRDDIAAADIIVVSIGGNDLEAPFSAWTGGTCGGDDRLDCFRDGANSLRAAYDGMLSEIDGLRGARPTAVRMVTTSNEFLADAGLIQAFGADFGKTGGVAITTMNRDVQCEVAEMHHAGCVDLGVALNGPDLLKPSDVNTQETMQTVANTIAAAGLEELGL
jgi:lysophospholipase L1-like esterase